MDKAISEIESSTTVPRAEAATEPAAPPFAPEGKLPVGEVIDGRFRIEQFLASGGMGDIYQATHIYMKRRVALKLIHQAFAGDPELAARFQREAELISRLESPNVVRVFDFGRTGTSFYLAMELIDGVALDAILEREGALAPGRAVPLLLQIGDAVAEAHSRSIIHRDLKPANILVIQRPDGSDFPKVLDFGIARLIGSQTSGPSLTHPGLIIGTPAYMAPEVALGQPDIDARADIYSFGAMAFELLAGRQPFQAHSLQELMALHINQPPPNPNELRPELSAFPALCEVVLTALAKDRAQRFADMRALQAALESALREPGKVRAQPAAARRPLERQRADPIPGARPASQRPAVAPLPGMGWGPAVLGAAVPSVRAKTVRAPPAPVAPQPTPPRSRKEDRDDSRVLALAGHLESLVPLLSRGETATLLTERLKGFGRRNGVVLAVELDRPANPGADPREVQLETRRCLAQTAAVATTYGLCLDWLDSRSAILLLDGVNLASIGQRAARAALAMREAMQTDVRPGALPRIRLALASGAYSMPTDAGPCAGAAIDSARKLVQGAPDDSIVIEEALLRCAGQGLIVNTASTTGAYLLERPVTSFVACPAAPVGREAELKELEGLLGREVPLNRRAVLLLGGPGSGKTWLADELAARVRKRGDRVAFLRDLRSQDPPPSLAGLPTLLAGLCDLAEADLAQALPGALQSLGLPPGTLAAALAMAELTPAPRPQPTPGEACHVLLSVGQAMAGGKGVLFVFDDLDCAQAATQAMFRQLAARLPARFGAVATSQSAGGTGSAADLRSLALSNLSRLAIGDVVKALVGAPPPPELVDFVARQSGGVPEVVEDWVRVLAHRGFLVKSPGGCSFSPPPRPMDAAARLAARVEVFDPTARRCLEAACLLGPAFDATVVEQALALPPSADLWSALNQTSLVKQSQGRLGVGRRHRAAVLARANQTGAAEVHARFAAQLRSAPPPFSSETARRIARHLAAAGDLDDSLAIGVEAASSAIESRELRVAALLLWDCGAALERHGLARSALTPAQAATQRVQHLSRATALALASGDLALATAIAAPLESEGHIEGVEAASGLERLLVQARLRLRRGDVAGSSKLLAWIPEAHPSAAEHPMFLAEKAELHVAAGSPALAVEPLSLAAQSAAAVAELAFWHGEVDFAARLQARLGDVLFLQADAEGARAAYGQALIGLQAARYPAGEARVLASLGALTAQAGHLEDSVRMFEGAQASAEAQGDLLFQAQALLRIGQARWQLDDRSAAKSFARAARDLAEQIQWEEGVQYAQAMLDA